MRTKNEDNKSDAGLEEARRQQPFLGFISVAIITENKETKKTMKLQNGDTNMAKLSY